MRMSKSLTMLTCALLASCSPQVIARCDVVNRWSDICQGDHEGGSTGSAARARGGAERAVSVATARGTRGTTGPDRDTGSASATAAQPGSGGGGLGGTGVGADREVSGGGGKKSNNGHGNNLDGVDSSNPGRGKGGPDAKHDPSGRVDDERR
jgi:hypothetical protein